MPLVRDVRTLAVLLALESFYLLVAVIVSARFGASMANFDGGAGRGQSGVSLLLGLMAAFVLGFTSVHLWRTGRNAATLGGMSTDPVGSALLVNFAMLAVGFVSGFWLLVVVALLTTLLLVMHLVPSRKASRTERSTAPSAT